MQGGDLRAALSGRSGTAGGRLHWWNGGKRVALDTARGLAFLHANRAVLRDIKSANILLSREGRAKICDVGMARCLGGGASVLSGSQSALGTFAWAAPELLLGQRCGALVGFPCTSFPPGSRPCFLSAESRA